MVVLARVEAWQGVVLARVLCSHWMASQATKLTELFAMS
jgi:hypothetical protein